MKKPLNKFAIVMWVTAVVVPLFNMASTYETYSHLHAMTNGGGDSNELYLIYQSLAAGIGGNIVTAVKLVGLGALIELIDQIRWDQKPR